MKNLLLITLATVFLASITFQNKIFIGNNHKTLAIANYNENSRLIIKFIHSVQKTPVIEEFYLKNGKFILQRTKYQSQGVGLPFDIADGHFYRDNHFFILDMNRQFDFLELRTGKNTQLTVIFNENVYELYKIFPVGTKIIVKTF